MVTFSRAARFIPIAAAATLASACATIVEGTDQTVTVNTDPDGAVCELSREGDPVAVVNPTPGTVTVNKSSHSLIVTCDKEGYGTAVEPVASTFQAMTVGNVVFGGVVGVGVDAVSGAMNEYPESVRIRLTPARKQPEEPDDTDAPTVDPAQPDTDTPVS